MSYGTKYELLMTSRLAEDAFSVKIKKNGYSSAEVDRDVPLSPFILKKDKASYVRGTSLQISIREITDFEFLEFYTNDPKEYLIELYKSATCIWKGYVVPQQYQVPYTPAPTNVVLLATDGLGLLKEESFTLTGRNSELTKICYCVDKIGLDLGFAIAVSVRPNGQATDRAVLDQVYTDCEIYTGKTCYEVLEDILKKYDADITQVNGRWHIIRSTDRKTTRMLYTSAGVYDTTQAAPTVLNLKSVTSVSTDVRPIGSLSFALQAGGKQVTISHDYGRKDTFLDNGNFAEFAAGEFAHWTKSEAFTVDQRDFDGKKYMFIENNHATDKYEEQVIPIVNVTGQAFVFSVLCAAFGYYSYGGLHLPLPIDVRVMVYVEDGTDFYCLTRDNVWGTINVSQLMTFSQSSSIGEPQFNEIKIVTDEIPLSGNLHVRLFTTKMAVYGDKYYLGVAFADVFTYFLNNGQKYPSSIKSIATFDNSKEPNILTEITLLAGNAPDLSNASYLYLNILRKSDGTPITDWRIDGSATDYTLIELMAETLASNNRVARQKLTGELRGTDLSFDSIVKHAYNSNKEFEITECEWDPYIEKFKVTLIEILSWSDESVTFVNTESLGKSASPTSESSASTTTIIMTGADILTKLIEVDGSGSGLDADTLDGEHGSAFVKLASPAFTTMASITHATNPYLRLVKTDATARNFDIQIIDDDLYITDATASEHAVIIYGGTGAAEFRYDNVRKFEITATGVQVSGGIIQAGADFNFRDDGTADTDAVRVLSASGNLYLQNGDGGYIYFRSKLGSVTGSVSDSGNLSVIGDVTAHASGGDGEGFVYPVTTVVDTYDILVSDYVVVCNKGTSFTVTLPVTSVGKMFIVKNIGAGVVTIEGNGADTIDGAANDTLNQWDSLTLVCYAANKWGVV